MLCPSCRAPNAPDAESCLHCGKSLYSLTRGATLNGRYEILDVLGKGGMGLVYKARDLELHETVALKVLRADVGGRPEMAERFRTEIKLARRVSHPNVCRIHDYGREEHLTYIAMEYLEGTDLKRELKVRGPLPAREALETAIQMAEGVDAVHRVGIVHRDLKTSNVMRTTAGAVKLMDFGIAKSLAAEDAAHATASGHIIGTPEYMSPEQARGETVDSRSDVYALGIVIFELLVGDVPFRGDTPVTTLMKHLREPPPLEGPPAARLPAAVVPLLRKALDKSPEARHASVRALIDDLQAARSSLASGSTLRPATEALPTSPDAVAPTILDATAPVRRPAPASGSFPVGLVLAGLAAVALIAVAVGIGVLAWRNRGSGTGPRVDASPSAATASPRDENAIADSPATHAAAREALSRARVLELVAATRDLAPPHTIAMEAPRIVPAR